MDTEERIQQAIQVVAKAGDRKLDSRSRILDYKDQVREARRRARMAEKGY